MIKIATFTVNPFGENSYLLFNETKECIVVDAGFFSPKERELLSVFIEKNELKPILALNTHAHIDHACGVQWVKDIFDIPFALNGDDFPVLNSIIDYGASLGFVVDTIPSVERTIVDGDTIKLGEDTITIIHTPGHTAGGVCLYIKNQKMLLTGDTLFRESIGRTDLPTGNYEQLMHSIIEKVLPLGGDVTIFAGHGQSSTLSHEITQNPFIAEVLAGDIPYKK